MSCESNNATAPSAAIAPGGEGINPLEVARRVREMGGVDQRLPAIVPGFDAPFFQAGLAGYSDAAMRLIARRHGCPYCVTEALLDRTLLAGGRGFAKADLGELHDNVPGGAGDHPLAGQIMGSDPEEMAAAALKMIEQGARTEREYRRLAYRGRLGPGDNRPAETLRQPGGEVIEWVVCGEDEDELGREDGATEDTPIVCDSSTQTRSRGGEAVRSFEVIDVNLACPVKKIASKARGGHWLAEPEGAIRILKAVRDALPASVACTVKLRRSFDDTPEMAANFERILIAVRDLGYAWATVHGRTVRQKYVGPSRWDVLRDIVRRHEGFPILGSGDVWSAGDIFRMIGYAGVAAVSVARGCIGNPWIFRQARQILAGERATNPTLEEQRGVLEEHFELLLAVNRGMRHGEEASSRMIRKFGIRFAAHHPEVESVRKAMIAVESHADWRRMLETHYAGGGHGEPGIDRVETTTVKPA